MPIHGKIRNPELRAILKAEGLFQIAFEALAADDNWHLTSTNFGGAANEVDVITSFTVDECPGWPVCPVTVVTDAAADDWTAVSVEIKGYDQFGDFITHTVAATNSSGTWTASATLAFQKLVQVTISVSGTTTSSDAYIIGFVKTYGIGRRLGAAGDVIETLFDGSADAGTVSAANSTYAVAGTPDGAKELVILLRPTYYLE